MTTVAIQSIQDASGQRCYRAVAGDKQSIGKTAGQALDALTTQLGEAEFKGVLVLQSFCPDQFFGAEQQKRLSELMELWRKARDEEKLFPKKLQEELDSLVEAELNATAKRAKFLMQQQSE